ncbi:hypothetical protein [Andreprevotia lacus]|jgi:hypothetical protein|nr:hypothetical protein [Andreprevotia lacus]
MAAGKAGRTLCIIGCAMDAVRHESLLRLSAATGLHMQVTAQTDENLELCVAGPDAGIESFAQDILDGALGRKPVAVTLQNGPMRIYLRRAPDSV